MESNAHSPQRASVDPHDPLVGRVLDGRYRIDSRIARGGMAAVYLAHDTRLDRTVAVKVMHPGMADDPAFVERFVREARAAAQLTHRNVVAVHDQGDDNGTLFLAMEYVPGPTLRDVIREQAPMEPLDAMLQVEPILSALSAAHRAGLVHRDVKPENVLIAPGDPGEPPVAKVADFGLAKAVNTATQHTATGVVIGSVSYLAPELVVKGRADERVDVYAVGVVLFELLTGRRPHEGESPIQIAYAHVHSDVPAPSSLAPGIPGYVDALVARACARDTAQRPADASVLLHHVRRVAQALREGVAEDEDLEADLRPHAPITPLEVEVEAERSGIQDVEDTEAERLRVLVSPAAPAVPETTDTVGHGPQHTGHFRVGATGSGDDAFYDQEADSLHDDLAGDDSEHTQQIETGGWSAAEPRVRRLPAPTADRTRADELSADRYEHAAGEHADEDVRAGASRSGRGPFTVALAILLALAVGVAAWWFGFGRYETTPSVLEMSQPEATRVLEDAGFSVEVADPTYSENVPKGEVVDTDPAPGEKVVGGGEVSLVLSLGPERYEVPRLVGSIPDEAGSALKELKLELGRETEKFHDTVPKGQVVSSDPTTGTVVKPGTVVNVVVSKGRKPVELTDFTGKNADTARKSLSRAGLEVDVEEKFSDDVDEGRVISQKPKSGTLYKGDKVSLVVSKGPELMTVPDVRRQGLAEAKKRLEALGFKVATEKSALYLGLQYVAGSNPGAGKKARKGSTITLSLV